ncbi:DUF2846 domain-containing protein [Curvivirga sp.]|uniref:DUF2846 domain-containing protein n=1 Tax=Curvivirga sp. TaxID=2856848 RepID=UPI003B595E07
MFKKIGFFAIIFAFFVTGCASVPLESGEKSQQVKQLKTPPEGKAGLYIYRKGFFGGGLKKDVWIDGKCIGETAPDIFFYEEVDADKEYEISTESEFSPNDLIINAKDQMLYFIRQYIKPGLFVHGADLELIDEEKGKQDISKLKLAVKGTCS